MRKMVNYLYVTEAELLHKELKNKIYFNGRTYASRKVFLRVSAYKTKINK